MKHLYLLTAKTTPDVNNALYFYMVQKSYLGDFLHVIEKFSLN